MSLHEFDFEAADKQFSDSDETHGLLAALDLVHGAFDANTSPLLEFTPNEKQFADNAVRLIDELVENSTLSDEEYLDEVSAGDIPDDEDEGPFLELHIKKADYPSLFAARGLSDFTDILISRSEYKHPDHAVILIREWPVNVLRQDGDMPASLEYQHEGVASRKTDDLSALDLALSSLEFPTVPQPERHDGFTVNEDALCAVTIEGRKKAHLTSADESLLMVALETARSASLSGSD